jgi:hypothetical protein
VTLALALIGIGISLGNTAWQVWIYLQKRDKERPYLVPTFDWNVGTRGDWIGVQVYNRPGGLPTTLIQAGFCQDGEAELTKMPGPGHVPGAPDRASGELYFPLEEDPVPIAPGEYRKFRVPAQGNVLAQMDDDTVIRPYVVDIEGNTWRGPPQDLFRQMRESGWQPSLGAADPIESMLVNYTAPPEMVGLRMRVHLPSSLPSAVDGLEAEEVSPGMTLQLDVPYRPPAGHATGRWLFELLDPFLSDHTEPLDIEVLQHNARGGRYRLVGVSPRALEMRNRYGDEIFWSLEEVGLFILRAADQSALT